MDLIALANRRRGANIPKLDGKIVCPYHLPERHDGEDILEFAGRAPDNIKDYLRDVIRWTRDYQGIAPPGFVRLMERVRK